MITAFDWHRMFIGDAPPLYFLEIIFRIAIIWPWAMFLLRWIGGRSIAQLSLVEFLLVIGLGSAVGDSLFIPDVPIFHAMLVIFVVVCIDKGIDQLIRRYHLAKTIIDGQPIEMVKDGVIATTTLSTTKISTLELMELLRLRNVENLGSIRRAYLETTGQLSVFGADPPLLGLPIVPPVEFRISAAEGPGPYCCANCGMIAWDDDPCDNCSSGHKLCAEQAPRLE